MDTESLILKCSSTGYVRSVKSISTRLAWAIKKRGWDKVQCHCLNYDTNQVLLTLFITFHIKKASL